MFCAAYGTLSKSGRLVISNVPIVTPFEEVLPLLRTKSKVISFCDKFAAVPKVRTPTLSLPPRLAGSPSLTKVITRRFVGSDTSPAESTLNPLFIKG